MSWKAAARLRLPEATAEVLASLGEHRILSTAQVRSIHFPDRSVRRAQQVLAYLERAGLVASAQRERDEAARAAGGADNPAMPSKAPHRSASDPGRLRSRPLWERDARI